jgi:hypothetical protein
MGRRFLATTTWSLLNMWLEETIPDLDDSCEYAE